MGSASEKVVGESIRTEHDRDAVYFWILKLRSAAYCQCQPNVSTKPQNKTLKLALLSHLLFHIRKETTQCSKRGGSVGGSSFLG